MNQAERPDSFRPQSIQPGSTRWRGMLLAAALTAMPLAGAAAQGSNDTRVLLERITRLEQQLNQLQRQVYRGEAPPAAAGGGEVPADAPALARLIVRADQIEEQIRSLTGRLEEVDFRSSQVNNRLDRLVEDVDFRLSALERGDAAGQPAAAGAPGGPPAAGAAPGPAAASRPAPGAAPRPGTAGIADAPPTGLAPGVGVLGTLPADAVAAGNRQAAMAPPPPGAQPRAQPQPAAPGGLPPGSPKEQYDFATNLLHRGDFEAAELALDQFVSAHPDDALASAAQYWLGESFFVRKRYADAASAFLSGYQRYPRGSKAPDNLLKLGMSLNNLQRQQEACAVYKQLADEYPNAEARIRETAERERSRAGCR